MRTDNEQTKTDFAAFYSPQQLADYAMAYEAYRAAQDNKSAQRDAVVKAWLDQVHVFEGCLYRFLQAKAAAGELPIIPHIGERGLRWGDAWNRLAKGQDPGPHDDASSLVSGMASVLFMAALDDAPRAQVREGALEAAYRKIVQAVTEGRHMNPQDAYGPCQRTGERLYARMQTGWEPIYGRLGKSSSFTPLTEDVPDRQVHHASIPLPTGEVLVADWFRIPAFTEAVKTREPQPSLESEAGLAMATQRYAEYGLLSIFVSNTSPHLVVRPDEGQLLLLEPQETQGDAQPLPAGTVLERVCTDLWWVSLIDRQVLTELVAQGTGQEEAVRLVDELVGQGDVQVVRLPAGTMLHAYHASPEGLQRDFECPEVDTDRVETLYASLSTKELRWTPRVKAPAARMAAPRA